MGIVLVREECRERPKIGWVGEGKRGRNEEWEGDGEAEEVEALWVVCG